MDAQAPPSAAAVAPGVVPPRRMPAAARGRKKQALNVGVALRRRPRSKRVPVRYEDSLDASYSEKVHMRLAMNNSRVVTVRKAALPCTRNTCAFGYARMSLTHGRGSVFPDSEGRHRRPGHANVPAVDGGV